MVLAIIEWLLLRGRVGRVGELSRNLEYKDASHKKSHTFPKTTEANEIRLSLVFVTIVVMKSRASSKVLGYVYRAHAHSHRQQDLKGLQISKMQRILIKKRLSAFQYLQYSNAMYPRALNHCLRIPCRHTS